MELTRWLPTWKIRPVFCAASITSGRRPDAAPSAFRNTRLLPAFIASMLICRCQWSGVRDDHGVHVGPRQHFAIIARGEDILAPSSPSTAPAARRKYRRPRPASIRWPSGDARHRSCPGRPRRSARSGSGHWPRAVVLRVRCLRERRRARGRDQQFRGWWISSLRFRPSEALLYMSSSVAVYRA